MNRNLLIALLMLMLVGCGAATSPTPRPTITPTIIAELPPPTRPEVTAESGLELRDFTYYRTNVDWIYLIATVENTGSGIQRGVLMEVTFLDESGGVVGVDTAYAMVKELLPGQRTPLRIVLEPGVPGWASLRADLSTQFAPQDAPREYHQDFEIIEMVEADTGFPNAFRWEGDLRNVGDFSATNIGVIVMAYNEAGELIGVERGTTPRETVPPGQTDTFTVLMDLIPSETIATYEMITEGFIVR